MSRGNRDRNPFRSSDFTASSDTWNQRTALARIPDPPELVAPSRPPSPRPGTGKPDPRACPGPCNSRYREAWKAHDQAVAEYDPLDSAQSRPAEPDLGCWLGEPV
jgi:hypothetical protein